MSLRAACLWCALIVTSQVLLAAEDPALREIRALLVPMRAKPIDPSNLRGATPPLTVVKHKLRDWIERQLHEFHDKDEVRAFGHELNRQLRAAKLSCDWRAVNAEDGCPDRGSPGYLDEIRLNLNEALIVTTSVGITCGFDESAYAYAFIKGRWSRFWESETNNYVKTKYVPLNYLGLHLSSRDYVEMNADPNVRLFLVLARDPAFCESNWYNVYYRVWQLRIDRPEERLLLDGGELAFLGGSVDGVTSPNDVLIEYETSMTYTDFEVRPVIRHYVLRDGKLVREPPLALSPRDFVDEWMRTDWTVSSEWTSAGVNPAPLDRMHTKKNFEGGQYTKPLHCEKRPDHWQVGLYWYGDESKQFYFLVRWLPPYRFSMTGVSRHPWPGCTEEDPEADRPRSLFPIHSDQRW